ncbi:MAG: NGG1p interacting factor NIF3 [Cellvibrio sp.]|nr:NGG1p interacting factor NIF3 [Cellvibrio sp.]
MHKIIYYVPESHLELTKSALFTAGAGRYKNYDQCCWQVLGQGQFRPLENSNPFVGESNQLTQIAEYRVELICEDDKLQQAITALRAAHPYEEPAIDVWQLETD